jgi:CubicO group peptidase (beta-lactamase class C family)
MRRGPLDDAVALVRARGARAALVVQRGGRTVLDRSFGCRPDALFWTFSAGKPFTALLVHQLAEQGALELDAPVARYWPEFGRFGKESITLLQVLQHRAGFGGARAPGDVAVMTDWGRTVRRLERARPAWTPGTDPGYSPIAAGFVLGEVVQRVTRRRLAEVLEEQILRPLGLTDTSLGLAPERLSRAVPVHGTSVLGRVVAAVVNRSAVRRAPIPSGGISSTARDLARFYGALLAGGRSDGTGIVSAATLARALEPPPDDRLDRVARYPIRWSPGFQLGGPRSVPGTVSPMGADSSPRAFGHNGSNCCIAWADPDRDLVFVHLTDRVGWPLPDLRYHAAVADRVLAAVEPAEPSGDRARSEHIPGAA